MGRFRRNRLFIGFALSWTGGRWTQPFTIGLQRIDHEGFNPGIWFCSEKSGFSEFSLFGRR